MPTLSIDVVSDIICPWCVIGTRRLDQALAAFPDVIPEITYHPFLLDPSTPVDGVDLRERLARKYGVAPAQLFSRVEQAARESGIPLDFAKVTRTFSTVNAHTLLRHALSRGTQRALLNALFEAYFFEGRDFSAPAELAKIAEPHGFTLEEVLTLLRDEAELQTTRDEAHAATAQGVTGVPFFIFAGRLAFSGAQSVDTMKRVIARAIEISASGPAASY